ncbi:MULTISPECIES: hypothetical protein [unclassified Coleofasciculus]|uniref:hypothetical protein n=1 Tax=unclassified Coleofasciculus TaxID=2692782 RepID=UPI001882953B|nr:MULTISPECIES: hypothetical protein [unclassified Coleofasciculus]MBE9124779.1 hypothetical protein [Coleofasciculus sp. LEGE 07081]MBE9148231.1 hypothetical protein [Coleofasciculus sp. LEGE 07092]
MYATGEDTALAREMLGQELPDLEALSLDSLQQAQQQLAEVSTTVQSEELGEAERQGTQTSAKESESISDRVAQVKKANEQFPQEQQQPEPSLPTADVDTEEIEAVEEGEAEGKGLRDNPDDFQQEKKPKPELTQPADWQERQQERVEAIAPVVYRHLKDLVGGDRYCGSHHTASLDKDEEGQRLIVTENQSSQKILEARQKSDGSWHDIDSNLDDNNVQHFRQIAASQEELLSKKGAIEDKVEQQNRVDKMAPTIVKHLSLVNRLSVKGNSYSSKLDPEKSELTLSENATEKPILKARFIQDRWRDNGSEIDEKTLEFFENSVKPKVEKALAQRSQRERLERQEKEAQYSL